MLKRQKKIELIKGKALQTVLNVLKRAAVSESNGERRRWTARQDASGRANIKYIIARGPPFMFKNEGNELCGFMADNLH